MTRKKDELREIRLLDALELTQKIIKRLDDQQLKSIGMGERLNLKKIDGVLDAITKTTGDKQQNKKLRNAYKTVLFEMNDTNPHVGLIRLGLIEFMMELVDALGEHSSKWEEIVMRNAEQALKVEGRVHVVDKDKR